MRQGKKLGNRNRPTLSLRNRLVLGTALVTSAFVGGYRGYVRRAFAACAPTAGTYLCSGVTTTTQKLPVSPVGVLTVTTDNTFDIDTTVTGGDAFTLTGTGGLTFSDYAGGDPNFSTITGFLNGIAARNYASGALAITTTGTVTGTNLSGPYLDGVGIIARNSGTDLTINAVDVSGAGDGITARNLVSGVLSITATGTVTSAGYTGIFARNYGTDLTINAVDVSGEVGITGQNYGTGALSITTTGTVTGTTNTGIFGTNNSAGTYLTINAADATGAVVGINARNYGSGPLSITATGTVTGGATGIDASNFVGALSIATTGTVLGTSNAGIYARNGSCGEGCSPATDLTIAAADVSGGTYGIQARNFGSGVLSITATGTVTGTDAAIYARSGTSIYRYGTDLTIVAAGVTGGTTGIDAISFGSGVLSITATGTVTGTSDIGIHANGTNLTINAAAVSGGTNGISAYNNSGALSITATGAVSGTSDIGIYATNSFNGTNLTINAAAVSGGTYGIGATNKGTGALSITATGAVTGTNAIGISAVNYYGTNLTINAAAVSGGTFGIGAISYSGGAISISATGAVTGTNASGIYAVNVHGTNLTINAAAVSGGTYGISAINFYGGALSISATGAVTGTNASGIYAHNNFGTTNLTIVAADVSGAVEGIGAINQGSGALTITATGTVTATGGLGNGIYARNYGTVLTVGVADVSGTRYGIRALNDGSGALSITATGTVTGTGNAGIFARNGSCGEGCGPATGLTIAAADVSGGTYGIQARNFGSGALSITATGTVTGTGNAGIFARNSYNGTHLTIVAAGVTGGTTGIDATNDGTGALSITATGTVTGTSGTGISATNEGTALTIMAAGVTGGTTGIYANNDGTGALTITTSGAVEGTSGAGIDATNEGTALTIVAAGVTGGTTGIDASNFGSGPLSITATGVVTGNGGSGIYARNVSAATNSTTVVVQSGAAVSGSTMGVELVSSTGRAASVENAGSIAGATGILANTAGSVTITNAGSISGTGGTAINLTGAGASTVNQQGGVVSGNILLSAGSDAVTVLGGTIVGAVSGGSGNDTVTVSGGAIRSIVSGGDGNDVVRISGGVIGTAAIPAGVELGAGADSFEISSGTVFGNVSGEGGADTPAADSFDISGGTITGSVFGLGGGNTFNVSGGAIDGSVFAGSQNDTVTISGTANIQGAAAIGPDAVGLEDGDDIFTMTGGHLLGAVSGGNGNDVLTVGGGTIDSFVAGNDGADRITFSGGSIAGDVIGGNGVDQVAVSGGSIGRGIDAETVTLTGGAIGGDITGVSSLAINDPLSPDPINLRNGVIFSGNNAVATIIDTDLSRGGTRSQVFSGFDTVTVDPSTIAFSTGTIGIGLLNLQTGSTLFVNGNVNMTGSANVVSSTIDMLDGAADDVFTLGGLALNSAKIRLDLNQQTAQADQIVAGALSATGTNVIIVNLVGKPSFAGQTNIPIIISSSGVSPSAFVAQPIPGTVSSLFTYVVLPGPNGGLVLSAIPTYVGLAVATQDAINVGTVDTVLNALYGVIDDASAADLGLVTGSQGVQISPTVGVFASGQFAHAEHDGFTVSTGGLETLGPAFDVDEFSAAISVDLNAAKQFDLDKQYGLNLGLFGGYASADVDLGSFGGFDTIGDGTNKSGMFGGYGLFRQDFNYVLVSTIAFLGESDVTNTVLNTTGSYDTQGYGVTGSVGHIFALDDRMRFDLRGGLLGVTFRGDDFVDSGGFQYGSSRISFGAFKFEPGIYADYKLGNGMVLSPYARADLQQRFGYRNTANIEGVEIDFDDADFSAAVSTGFNLKMSETATMSGEVRGKFSTDSSTLGGKLGIKIAF